MGYNLTIGNLEQDEQQLFFINEIELPNSPMNSNDNHSNTVAPSYSAWAEFCKRTGLKEIFATDLLAKHPGHAKLTKSHLKTFEKARDAYFKQNDQDRYDIKRLNWLCWWTDWALKNCETPSMLNS